VFVELIMVAIAVVVMVTMILVVLLVVVVIYRDLKHAAWERFVPDYQKTIHENIKCYTLLPLN